MSETTPKLGLFKYNTSTDGKLVFDINMALNNNWDILDNCGSPDTQVIGSTWIRQWSDGWKEQGGVVSMSSQEVAFVRPNLTSNNTMDGNTFAVSASSENTSNPAFRAFDIDSGYSNGNCWCPTAAVSTSNPQWIMWYNPVAIKIPTITIRNGFQDTYNNNSVKAGKLQYSTDGTNWTDEATFDNTTTTNPGGYWSFDITNPVFSKYKRLYITSTHGLSNTSVCRIADISFNNAVCITESANSVIFPTAFSNTNYNHTISFEGQNDGSVYINSKTTTGMTLGNSGATTCIWSARGY